MGCRGLCLSSMENPQYPYKVNNAPPQANNDELFRGVMTSLERRSLEHLFVSV